MAENTIKALLARVENPGSEYRSAPFWGWNARLERSELQRQLADMKDKGMGGVFLHSREGLETPYLSGEWMEAVRVSLEKAKAEGLELWIYDEDKWPSGSAGGMVSAADPEAYTAKGLTLEVLPAGTEVPADPAGVRTVLRCRAALEGSRIKSLGTGENEIILRRELSGRSEWYNGYAPPDNLNPEAVKKFLELTHEKYRERFGGEFGKSIRGFFTDEPDVCDFYAAFTPGRPWLPWTDGFVAYFTDKRGYDPTDKLPLLFFTGEGAEKLRHDYWRTVSDLFGEAYMKQLFDYCGDRGLELTGHVLYENDLGYGIRVSGAAMPQYRYLHRPGIDLLGEQTREYLTVRQCSSVANQYGRKDTICEAYGCTGWEFDFEGQKWLGDWMFVNGITRRCQHLTQYSIAGCRKRDYPPVFNYQNTWWEYNAAMEDYFARVTACVQAGSVRRDILVLHPISGLWTLCGSDPGEDLSRVEMNMGWTDRHIMELNELGERYNRLTEALLRQHLDFDFGDETILAENACVEGSSLRVGCCRYTTVVVPETRSLFASTIDLLEKLQAAGGTVIWTGEAPTMTEGEPSGRAAALAAQGIRAEDEDALVETLRRRAGFSVKSLSGTECTDILTMLRKTEDGYVLFAVNNSRETGHFARFCLPFTGSVTALDPWTGEKRSLTVQKTAAGMQFGDSLPPVGSCVYLIETGVMPAFGRVELPYEHPHRTEPVFAALGPVARVCRTAPNALTLDYCSYRLGEETFSAEQELWMAQRELRERLGLRPVWYNGAPQRYSWLPGDTGKHAPFALRFCFTVRDLPETPCRLAVEKPEGLSLQLNGEACTLTEEWYSDRAMRCYLLPELKPGVNELVLSGEYTEDRELEDVFLLGDFAVDNARCITKESGSLHFGDWCFQGYPHYSGAMVYAFTAPALTERGSRVTLHMGEYRAAVAEVFVNGSSAGLLFGKCRSSLDITAFLRDTENEIEIKVTGTPRNLYGPFHQGYTGCSRISWADFRTEDMCHCDGYVLEPYGLMGQLTLTIT